MLNKILEFSRFTMFWIFYAMAPWAVVAIFLLNSRIGLGGGSWSIVVGLCGAAAAITVTWFFRGRIKAGLDSLAAASDRISVRRWLVILIAGAGALRLAWIYLVPVALASDGATYFGLAARLVETGFYGGSSTGLAYWPPGFPFFLTPFVSAFPDAQVAVPIANIFLYLVTVTAGFFLGRELLGDHAGKWTAAILAFWPNSIFSMSVASKENLLLCLLTVGILAFLYAKKSGRSRDYISLAVFSGFCFGWASLTQPSLLLLPLALLIAEKLAISPSRTAVVRFGVIVVAMIVVVAPWTARNYVAFGEFVLVSTNGGSVLYRSNNDIATGGYIQKGPVDLSHLDELSENRAGFQMGTKWIKENPGKFLLLAVKKQILFLGDDATGAYSSLRRSRGTVELPYVILKAVSNGYWMLIWLLILIALIQRRSEIFSSSMLVPISTILYLLAIDSVFESGGRHHIPIYSVIAVLGAIAFARRQEAESEAGT